MFFGFLQSGAAATDSRVDYHRSVKGSVHVSSVSESEIYGSVRSDLSDIQQSSQHSVSMNQSAAVVVPSPMCQRPLQLVGYPSYNQVYKFLSHLFLILCLYQISWSAGSRLMPGFSDLLPVLFYFVPVCILILLPLCELVSHGFHESIPWIFLQM